VLNDYEVSMARRTTRTTRRKTSLNKWRPWTEADLTALKKHSRKKTAMPEIELLMQRTHGAIRQKAHSLNLPIGHRRY
jgi:hypothetical protein